jgi:2-(1,2-epoxy-1,2-dihydrophenyl)acetyl-CoA isomerase
MLPSGIDRFAQWKKAPLPERPGGKRQSVCGKIQIFGGNMSDANSEMLLETLDRGLLTLTLNRPERRNALNQELCARLVEALHRAALAPEVNVILLKGAGGTFCVGGDVKAMAEGSGRDMSLEQRIKGLRANMEASRLLHDMAKPTVAAITGAAAGAGLSLALACDLRVASESAKLTTAFAKVGLSGDYGGTFFLTRLLGAARARELYLTSPLLSGTDAYRLGLVTRAVPEGETEIEAEKLARSLADGPRAILGFIKQNLNLAENGSLQECLDAEAWRHIVSSTTSDHREAAAAFVEKRVPRFTGN